MSKRSLPRKNRFGCDNAGNPIVEEFKDKTTGEKYGEVVQTSANVQKKLDKIIDQYVSDQTAKDAAK